MTLGIGHTTCRLRRKFFFSATSPARGKGEPGTNNGVDLKGNARPAPPDIGAYEAP